MKSFTHTDHDTGTVTRVRVRRHGRCGKLTFTSRKEARQAAALMRRDTGENVESYHCYGCHGHHLGHPPGQPRKLDDVAMRPVRRSQPTTESDHDEDNESPNIDPGVRLP